MKGFVTYRCFTKSLSLAVLAVIVATFSISIPIVAHASSSAGDPNQGSIKDPSGKRNVSYFQQWAIYGRNYLVKNVDTDGAASKLTTLDYAFGGMTSDLKCASVDTWADYQKPFSADQAVNGVADTGGQPLAGNFNQLKELKAKYPQLKVMISLGGWTLSAHFSDAALPQNVVAYVRSCIDMFINGNIPGLAPGAAAGVFDGIDVDWEYPAVPGNAGNVVRPEDTRNFTGLLDQFRHQLDALGAPTHTHYLLTIASPAGQDKYSHIELGRVSQSLDWINLMTYDMHGAWAAQGPTDIEAPLYCDPADPNPPPANQYCIDNTVRAYLAAGVPSFKINLGIPFYGRGWTNVPTANGGLYQSSPNMAPAPGVFDSGVNDYKALAPLVSQGYTTYRSSVTQGYWIFNGSTFWSYDDVAEVSAKVDYANSKGLGGVYSWAIDGDNGDLLNAISTRLRCHALECPTAP
ncbi:MAG TPA: glycoside hydrolase family 18 protein [Ktedonosporobacter sp.]|nr:glycoside hydrolase family 18 protein [Ktedonosporobacter sp.]